MICTFAHSRDPVAHDGLPPPDDVIEVDELRLRCVIGISREERRDRQDVVISLRIGTDARSAVVTDCVDAVWNYRPATKAIIAHVESSTYQTVDGLVIYRRPSDFLDTSQTLKGTALSCQDGER